METLEMHSDRGLLSVKWSDVNSLANFAAAQAGYYAKNMEIDAKLLDLHRENFKGWHQYCWEQRYKLSTYDIPNGSKILDIGCGVAIVDLLLYSYVPDSKFYLLDKPGTWHDSVRPNKISYTKEHPFYHSWEPILDAIKSSNFDKDRFNLMEPEDNFPEDLDLIISSFSWCFHYPKEIYWDKVLKSLKKGGKLYLDIRVLPDRDIIKEISDELNSEPIISEVPKLPKHLDNFPNNHKDLTAFRCLWIKK